jgi:outer membrane protein OmpA-like peptidoglycan-associated protein
VLYEDARPQEVIMVKGEVKSEDGKPMEDAVVEISYRGEEKSVEVAVNGDDGKFAAIIHVDKGTEKDVMLTVKKEGHSFDTQLIKSAEVKRISQSDEVIARGLEMQIDPIKVGKTFTIDNILFDTDSYVLKEDSKFVLDQFIKFLKENPTVKVTIEGHTDDLGDAAHNRELSANRAKSAMDYIVGKGVDRTRLKSVGYGEDKPKVPNSSDANRALNRRTDFMIDSM